MASAQHSLDDVIKLLRKHPGRTDEQVIKDLRQTYGGSAFTAKSILARVTHALNSETRRWRITRRRHTKPLPGETSGLLDNAIRILEEAGTY